MFMHAVFIVSQLYRNVVDKQGFVKVRGRVVQSISPSLTDSY